LGELVNLFSEHGFVRIHRSFIVNIARVRHIRPREREGWELNGVTGTSPDSRKGRTVGATV
jgi:DNA-binding LytR/AlgR family response regulator